MTIQILNKSSTGPRNLSSWQESGLVIIKLLKMDEHLTSVYACSSENQATDQCEGISILIKNKLPYFIPTSSNCVS